MTDQVLARIAKQKISFDNNIEMTVETITRWILFLEALSFISQKENEDFDIDEDNFILSDKVIDTLTKKAKPHKAISKYIEERFPAALRDTVITYTI